MKNQKKKLGKAIRGILLSLMVLLFAIFLLSQWHPAQRYAAQKAVQWLSDKLGTSVQLNDVHWRDFQSLELDGFLIRDLHQDTLLAAKQLRIRFKPLDLLQNRLVVEEIRLSDALLRLKEETNQSWNFDFVLKAFATDTTIVDTTATATNWAIEPHSLSLQNLRIEVDQIPTHQQLTAMVAKLEVQVDSLDLQKQELILASLIIQHPLIQHFDTAPLQDPLVNSSPAASSGFAFPDLGWRIQVDQTELKNGQVFYQKTKADRKAANTFDPAFIGLDGLQWDIRNVLIDHTRVGASIRSFILKDHSGFQVVQCSTDLLFTDTLASLQNFQLHTPNSEIRQSISIHYPALEALSLWSGSSRKYHTNDIRISADLTKISIASEDINRFVPQVLSPSVKDPFVLQAAVSGTLAQLNIKELSARQGPNLLLAAKGQLVEPLHSENFTVDLSIDALQGTYADLVPLVPGGLLPPGLKQWGLIKISASLLGKVSDLQIQNLNLHTVHGPQLKGDIQIAGLPDIQRAQLHLRLDNFTTSARDWSIFLPDSLPIALNQLGEMGIQGTFDGSLYQFETAFQMKATAGNLKANAHFDFNQDYSNASYHGKLQLQDLDLGRLLQDSLLGKVSMNASVDGSGLQAQDWNTDVQAVLSKLVYRYYAYDSIRLNGRLQAAAFDGAIAMKDPNVQFEYQGHLPLGDTLSSYKFDFYLDTLNLMPLGFYSTPLGLSMRIEADIQDLRTDKLEGELVVTDLFIRDSLHKFYADTIRLNSRLDEQNVQHLILTSDLLQMGLEGQYLLSQLPREIGDWIDQDFPIQDLLFPLGPQELALDSEHSIFPSPSTNISAYLHLGNPTALTKILLPELKKIDTLSLSLLYDRAKLDWELNLQLPALHYADFQLDSLSFNSTYQENNLTSTLRAERFQTGKNTTFLKPNFQTVFTDDSLFFKAFSAGEADSTAWQIGGGITTTGKELKLSFDSLIRLNGEDWKVQARQPLRYGLDHQWLIDQLRLEKNQELIQLDGQGNASDSASTFTAAFQQFDLNEFSPLLDQPGGYIGGTLNGRVEARNLRTNLNYLADLKVAQWSLDSTLIGDVHFQAQQNGDQPIIELSAALDGQGNNLKMAGTYDLDQQLFDVRLNMDHLSMQNVDPFLPGLIHASEGYLSGSFLLKGTPDRPVLNGTLDLHQLKTIVDYVNIPYRIGAGTVAFTENRIDLGELHLLDANDQQATLSGQIAHHFFSQLDLNLHFKTDRFQFLNTTPKDNALFYGKLFMKSDVAISGPPAQPRFFIDAKTQTGTQFNVVPLTDQQAIAQDDFIIFGRPALDSLGRDSNYLNKVQLAAPGVDLQLNLEMTSDAELQIIIDPLTGDKLVGKGISNLTVNMDPAGDLSIFGNYQITEGKYTFSYEQLLKREFAILPNSKISFNGDPLRARLDITAAYQTRVPLSDLIQDQVSTNSASLAGLRADVQVQMKISGDLAKPLLSFDIILLGNQQGAMADAATTRLEQLRTDETELNTQVFGLLLFNSFINSGGSGQSVTSAGETVLLSSVSKLISTQLNRLAGGLLKGVDINLGVEAYKPGVDPIVNTGVNTEVQLGVSKHLLNNRLNVKVGGSLNVGAGGQDQQALTALTGDFALEYLLTPNGNYLLRVYQRSDYDALYEGNVNKTGAGISIRKTFKNHSRKRKE